MENIAFVVETPPPNYGATSSSTSSAPKTIRSIIYCVHGKVAADCCDPESFDIKIIPPVEAHCHRINQRSYGIDKHARKKLIIASVLCLIFMAIEIVGGILSNSLAIATDAAHLLADLVSFMISLLAIYISSRRSTKRLSFGYHRAEVIGALVSVLLIWVVTVILVYMAVLRLVTNDFELDPLIMLISSAIGILVNVIMGCSLHDFGGHGPHGHSHSHTGEPNQADTGKVSESHAHNKLKPQRNMNVRAALIHVISDFVQSCGVFLAAIVIYFEPSWSIIDPICTFLFSILVLMTTIRILKDAVLVLMEATPEYMDYTEIMETLLSIEGVVRVHNLRVWGLSVSKIALAVHLAVEPNTDTEAVLREATLKIHAKYAFYETTLQIEVYGDEMEACSDCVNPV